MQMASMTIVSTTPRPATRRCECGCGTVLLSRRANARYVDERHRQRAYRKRLQNELREHGLPERLNLQTARGTTKRVRDAPKRRKPDLRVSYRKAVDAVAAELERFSSSGVDQRKRAERALAPLLSDRQRAVLKERS